jgi:hypothetical protein
MMNREELQAAVSMILLVLGTLAFWFLTSFAFGI